jgi:hypothetical protein
MTFDIVWSEAHESVLIELDERRRTSLGKVGRKEHTRYLVEEQADGTLIWRPAVVIPEHELRFMTAHPQEYAQIREQQANPDPKRLRDRPQRPAGTPSGQAERSASAPDPEPVAVGT